MAEWDIELDSGLIDGVKDLAAHYYGDVSDASIARVVEVALNMRLQWQESVNPDETEIEEPIVDWKFADRDSDRRLPTKVQNLLFKRR